MLGAMASKPSTVKEYLDSLPEDRRKALQSLRKVFKANMDKKFKEGIQYGMIGYFVPHSVYPDGYHCDPKQPLPFAGLASQKNHIGIYLFCIYGNTGEETMFRQAWKDSGKRLDMGKACVRVKKIEDVPLEVLAATLKRITAAAFIKHYETAIAKGRKPAKKAAKKKPATKKATKKKVAAKKTAAKKPVAKKKPAKKNPAKKKASR